MAKSSITLVSNKVKMMKVVQRQIQDDRLYIEDAWHTSTGGNEINRRRIIILQKVKGILKE